MTDPNAHLIQIAATLQTEVAKLVAALGVEPPRAEPVAPRRRRVTLRDVNPETIATRMHRIGAKLQLVCDSSPDPSHRVRMTERAAFQAALREVFMPQVEALTRVSGATVPKWSAANVHAAVAVLLATHAGSSIQSQNGREHILLSYMSLCRNAALPADPIINRLWHHYATHSPKHFDMFWHTLWALHPLNEGSHAVLRMPTEAEHKELATGLRGLVWGGSLREPFHWEVPF